MTDRYRCTDPVTPDVTPLLMFGMVIAIVIMILAGVTVMHLTTPANASTDTCDSGTSVPAAETETAPATPSPMEPLGASEINALLSAEEELNDSYYGGTLHVLPISWSKPEGNAYAYTDGSTIYFVTEQYERHNWQLNLEVLRHEVAHAVVGCEHGHDAAWKREFDRLMAGPNTRSVTEVRAGE
jgi:hypothetical protein